LARELRHDSQKNFNAPARAGAQKGEKASKVLRLQEQHGRRRRRRQWVWFVCAIRHGTASVVRGTETDAKKPCLAEHLAALSTAERGSFGFYAVLASRNGDVRAVLCRGRGRGSKFQEGIEEKIDRKLLSFRIHLHFFTAKGTAKRAGLCRQGIYTCMPKRVQTRKHSGIVVCLHAVLEEGALFAEEIDSLPDTQRT